MWWDLFVGAGFGVGVFYFFSAILAWQVAGLPEAELVLMCGTAWAFALCSCGHYGGVLEIPLYPAVRIRNRDHRMLDGSGVAFSAAGAVTFFTEKRENRVY